jgi:hypothetical protein
MLAVDQVLWLPVGEYSIHRGMFVLDPAGEKTILIGRGRSREFEVKVGQMNTWQLGGAGEAGFSFLGKASRNTDKGTVESLGKELHVVGNWGEEYFNFVAERLTVEFEVRKESETGPKVGTVTMKPNESTAEGVINVFWPAKGEIKNAPKNVKLFAVWTAQHGVLGKIQSKPTQVDD